jgi:vacuolar-type H+-ATPase subunit F/Vma7
MGAPVFIGDEAVAAGFRLCGLRSVVPAPGEELSALELARADAPLVLIDAACASRMPRAPLGAALAALAPLVLVIPDLRGGAMPPDLTREVRAQLGLGGLET